MPKKYYIISNDHTSYTATFWKPNGCGYTQDLEAAGVYENTDKGYPVLTKDNLMERRRIRKGTNIPYHKDFYIAVEDVELLGSKTTTIYYG